MYLHRGTNLTWLPGPATSAHALDLLLAAMYTTSSGALVSFMAFCAVFSSTALPFLLAATRVQETVCDAVLDGPDLACTARAYSLAMGGSLVCATLAACTALVSQRSKLAFFLTVAGAVTGAGTLAILIIMMTEGAAGTGFGLGIIAFYFVYVLTGFSMALVWGWVSRGTSCTTHTYIQATRARTSR